MIKELIISGLLGIAGCQKGRPARTDQPDTVVQKKPAPLESIIPQEPIDEDNCPMAYRLMRKKYLASSKNPSDPPETVAEQAAYFTRVESPLVLVRVSPFVPFYLTTHKDGTQVRQIAEELQKKLGSRAIAPFITETEYEHFSLAYFCSDKQTEQQAMELIKRYDKNCDLMLDFEEQDSFHRG